MTPPELPTNHPMGVEYARYMVEVTTGINTRLSDLIYFVAFLAVAFLFFAVQKWLDRREDRKRRLSMDSAIRGLETAVAAIHGLTAVNDVLQAELARRLEQATATVRTEIAQNPDKTANKVVEKLDEKRLGEAGIITNRSPTEGT